ncbi:hypothetical protein EXIGLDRAFT_87203 [Exidia glandulosa HHB12029]|uniref:Uncharacterized protein n=1 Tax=Exidia glandulosa HHB12029 TaxID=1314781 RepID=A0A166AH20_EXIGL|nr:hypothetical protein EXIGLDRAFT_87203 [Exidia glandulosa HHB12029]
MAGVTLSILLARATLVVTVSISATAPSPSAPRAYSAVRTANGQRRSTSVARSRRNSSPTSTAVSPDSSTPSASATRRTVCSRLRTMRSRTRCVIMGSPCPSRRPSGARARRRHSSRASSPRRQARQARCPARATPSRATLRACLASTIVRARARARTPRDTLRRTERGARAMCVPPYTEPAADARTQPYLHPHANPAFVGKGLTIPGVNNNEGGFIAHAHTHSAPVLRITTANEDENESDGFATSGYSSYGYDTPSPASSAYDLPPQSPYPTTPNSPFLSAPASPYIQNHGPTMTSSVFDVPSSPVKNAAVFNHSPFKSEVDLHPSPFLPTYAGSSNSSPSLYDQPNFTFTNNTNDSMLLGMSGSLFGAEERDEMKVEM